MVVPRVGMEVLVTFLEGDPDRPLVSGCLYHAEHLPPGKLPADQTQSVFKTLSSPGGGGSNELRIEDRAGQEHIYIHAQRDWDQIVKHDQTISVGHERHDRVQANSYSEFGAEEHRTVAGARLTEVKMSDHLTVGGTQHIRVADGLLAEAGQEVHIKAGNKLVIEAGLEVTIKVGGTFIKLDASGVKMIEPQPVGSPGNGSGAAPRLPGVATPVGADEAGEMLTPAQTQTMKRTPFCEQCERAAKEAKP
ncbi:Type IV secretion protein Rh [Pseudomonas syringae pv. coriandricola]|uniref:Type IV secretion protein Rh n=2 Tax=Pseudomonas syringae group genomosp. 3 TaxID=251701 RepID=A0A0P9R975_9PSED|nr:Type IV secretion protein Rh [Pseudomonas syringae pv. coriandricola]RMN07421.1 Type IV secretion protein Rh [Pseudomonas syringae pv. coriandricola]